MRSIAIYRLPHQKHCTLVEQLVGEPAELLSCAELNGRAGFVVAPFQATPEQPILLIRPDRVMQLPVSQLEGAVPDFPPLQPLSDASAAGASGQRGRIHYATDFANFHAQLLSGDIQKIVLSRCIVESHDGTVSPLTLFQRACQLYPRMFIGLVSTPKSGTWLTATPEILLEGQGREWRTIALAGTMKLDPTQLNFETPELDIAVAWTTKNIREQRMVATYITECLEQFTGDFREGVPCTVRAANLVHLRSDFTFTLPSTNRIGDLLMALHPTPAVCGLPKRQALEFILHNEHTPRRYYSGFMGMFSPQTETHLFVSLRCMNIARDTYILYAGGGLLCDSVEQQEWNETEAKLETMRAVVDS